jgi:hypothetical protein
MDHREKVAAGTEKLRHTTDVIKQALRTVTRHAACVANRHNETLVFLAVCSRCRLARRNLLALKRYRISNRIAIKSRIRVTK